MDELEFRRLLERFPIVRFRDYHVNYSFCSCESFFVFFFSVGHASIFVYLILQWLIFFGFFLKEEIWMSLFPLMLHFDSSFLFVIWVVQGFAQIYLMGAL